MKGELAILFALMSGFGGGIQGEGWQVQRADIAGRLTASTGAVYFGPNEWGTELRVTYAFNKWQQFNPVLDFSITDQAGAWLGVGLTQRFDISLGQRQVFAGFSFVPGLYVRGDEVNLGFPLEFRSGIELGVYFNNGWEASLAFDHRSNGDFSRTNPGVESLHFRISKSFY